MIFLKKGGRPKSLGLPRPEDSPRGAVFFIFSTEEKMRGGGSTGWSPSQAHHPCPTGAQLGLTAWRAQGRALAAESD